MKVSPESHRYRQIYELGYAFASRTELQDLIPFVIAKCREILHAEGVSVLLLDQEGGELYFPYISEEDPEVRGRLARLRFSATSGIAGAVLRSGRAEKVDDVRNDARFYGGIDQNTGFTTKSILAAPLIAQEAPLGVIEVVNHRSGEHFSHDDLVVLEELAKSIAVAIRNATRFSQLEASEQRLRTAVGALRSELARHDPFAEIVATSAAMVEVFPQMESAAATSIPVLIEGETGTGKELVARAIHRTSSRSEGPFLAINCAAIPETLLESELFGHRRGAFTGAISDQPGLFRSASGGTLFLDEISEMPLSMQAKLLRVLEEGEVTSLGEPNPRKIDVRLISATNRDLKHALATNCFRNDLYYRLAVFPIQLPPLRDRRDDIPLLAARFLHASTERDGKHIVGFDPVAIGMLCAFDWPGNVRQLRNEIERAAALTRDGEVIAPERLSQPVRNGAHPASPAEAITESGANGANGTPSETREPVAAGAVLLDDAREKFEAKFIGEALARSKGNVLRTAASLGVSRATLLRKIKQYHLR
jgi:Nif-specific regulatory protein